jgi:hypothetical protein
VWRSVWVVTRLEIPAVFAASRNASA